MARIVRDLSYAVSVALLSVAAPAEQSSAPPAVAVVSSLSGSAWITAAPQTKKTRIGMFDWLVSGTTIEVGPDSSVTLVFADGSRYELGGTTKATLTTTGPKAISGSPRPLEPVPPMPRIAAIVVPRDGVRASAIRIRGPHRIRGLYPPAGCTTLPDRTVLRFLPEEGAGGYRVELEDGDGRTVFSAQIQSPAVEVPIGILKPAAQYYWKVRTVDAVGPILRGESEFATLAAEDIDRRAALRARLETTGDAESLALLSEIDRRLGLLAEAAEGFRFAIAKAPTNQALQAALEQIEKQLSSESSSGLER